MKSPITVTPDVLAKGKELYEKQCLECHGKNGEGNKDKFYPVIAGQHYAYLLRQMTDIRDGKRRNANPDMVKIIKTYNDKEIDAIVDYIAETARPGDVAVVMSNGDFGGVWEKILAALAR